MRYWYQVHKWTSLICALVMLLLCVTGLPLIFHDELENALGKRPHLAASPILYKNLNSLISTVTVAYPDNKPLWVNIDYENPAVTVGLESQDSEEDLWVTLNAYTGKIIETSRTQSQEKIVLDWIFRLHVDLFAGLAGQLFMGFMGLLCILSLISGFVVYRPFMRFTDFGTFRADGPQRRKYSDLHKLLGVVVLVWASIVTGTGVLHTAAAPIYSHWQTSVLQPLLASYSHQTVPYRFSSVQQAVAVAESAIPKKRATFIQLPTSKWGSPYHYMVLISGITTDTAYWYTPVLVDAATGKLTDIISVPWYMRLLQLSEPLHFGNYGGLPLKILWALLDITTIGVICSGLYLWLLRKRVVPLGRVRSSLVSAGLPANGTQEVSQVQTTWKIWRIPLLLGGLTILGCTAPLLGEGIWKGLSWIFLSLPLVIAIWFSLCSGKNG